MNARGGVPSSVGIRVRNIIGPFVVRPFGKSTFSTFSMSPNPFGLEIGTVCPVSCRDENISVNGIIDGMEFVVVLYVVDPFEEGLIIAHMECWYCRCASDEVIEALEKDGDGQFSHRLCPEAGIVPKPPVS